MPIYEYQCPNEPCATRTERICRLDERPNLIVCPACGAEAVRVQGRTGRPKFEGSGFYETDYKVQMP